MLLNENRFVRQGAFVIADITWVNKTSVRKSAIFQVDLKRNGVFSTWIEGIPHESEQIGPGLRGFLGPYTVLPSNWGPGTNVSVRVRWIDGQKIIGETSNLIEIV